MERIEINRILSSAIEKSLAARGTNLAAIWMDREGALEKGVRRCEAIFRMINAQEPFRVLDVGCGPGFAVPFLEERYGPMVGRYFGIDVSEPLIAEAKRLWPSYRFEVCDIVANPLPTHAFEYAALNGVLTAKFSLSHEAMENFAQQLLEHCWQAASKAISFNVMSPHVDWPRDDLFHWPLDRAVAFCVAKLSRHLNVISDYGLYEYTVQVFRSPQEAGQIPESWK
jgi:SAM-dependent methyltransferase